MAITCSWDKPLGTCFHKYDKEKKFPNFEKSKYKTMRTYLLYVKGIRV